MSLSEILFVGLLGLVVFGPKKLMQVGQHVGQALAAFKKATSDFSTQVNAEMLMAEQGPKKTDLKIEAAETLESGVHPGAAATSL